MTGGASGIGEAVARYLAKGRAEVMISDLVDDEVNRVVAEIREAGGRAAGMKVDNTRDSNVA